jgi:hypothetical protein
MGAWWGWLILVAGVLGGAGMVWLGATTERYNQQTGPIAPINDPYPITLRHQPYVLSDLEMTDLGWRPANDGTGAWVLDLPTE